MKVPSDWVSLKGPPSMPASLLLSSRDLKVNMLIMASPKAAFGMESDSDIDLKAYYDEERITTAFAGLLKGMTLDKVGRTDINGIEAYYRIMNGNTGKVFIYDQPVKIILYLFPTSDSIATVYCEMLPAAYTKSNKQVVNNILDSISISAVADPNLRFPNMEASAAKCLDVIRSESAYPASITLNKAYFGVDGYEGYIDLYLSISNENRIVRYVFNETACEKFDKKDMLYQDDVFGIYLIDITGMPSLIAQDKYAKELDTQAIIEQSHAK